MDRKKIRLGLAWLAVAGMLMPAQLAHAAGRPNAQKVVAGDVSLSADGTLRGQVVAPQGRPVPGIPVAVIERGQATDGKGFRELASAVSGTDGRFEIRGVKAGVVTLAIGRSTAVYRVWTHKAAPPAARQALLVVVGDAQALGQSFGSGVKKVFTNPWVIAGIVAAAVAIPVAIHNSDDDDSPASP